MMLLFVCYVLPIFKLNQYKPKLLKNRIEAVRLLEKDGLLEYIYYISLTVSVLGYLAIC